MADEQLFQKVAAFTDIHFGLKGDSRQHNSDCENFIYWFIEQAKEFGAETCIFLGDWHHNRARINVSTLNYTVPNVERLGEAFEQVYLITGNHDLYYRDKREINSIEFIRNIDNVKIIDERILERQVAMVPWMVGREWKKIKKMKCKYMFGHFELPTFKMNAMVDMPDTGQLHTTDFVYPEYVFSGHFHKRQQQGNIVYIGNCFPHNFSDVDDEDNRGMMLLEWGGEPSYRSWPGSPKYRKFRLSQLTEVPETFLDESTYARVEIDIPVSYDEANYIKEMAVEEYNPRDISLMPEMQGDHEIDFGGELSFESVDEVVLSHLQSIESSSIDKDLLTHIYREL